MKLLASLALLASAVTANPILARQDASKPFHLKTASASNQDHNGLYVYAYHTGAGFNDAVLTQDEGKAAPAVLNGTTTQFQLSELQWGMLMPAATNYAGMSPVLYSILSSIDADDGSLGARPHQRRHGLRRLRGQGPPAGVDQRLLCGLAG